MPNENDLNPGQPGVDPAQVTAEPKEAEGGIDYKSFFDTQMNQRLEEKNTLADKLANDTKLSEQEKFRIEKQIFNIEKELRDIGFNPVTSKESIVEDIVKMWIQPDTEAYNYIKDAVKDLPYDDAKIVVEWLMWLVKAMWNKNWAPASLDWKIWNWGWWQWDVVWIWTKDLLWENSDQSKRALVWLIRWLAQKWI